MSKTYRTAGIAAMFLAAISGPVPAQEHHSHGAAPAAEAAENENPEAAYLAENDGAMSRMMADMETAPTGDVDRDFVSMMTPHHQGAIDMAMAVLRYGKNEKLRRIAQEIIIEQQQEIAAMRLAIGDALPPSYPAPTQVVPHPSTTGAMESMDPDMKM
jgi:uncharacterized protein (DUF305 family)